MVDIICHICNLEDLPATINDEWLDRKQSTKKRSSKVQNKWISCDCCLQWFHPFCCGLTAKEFADLASVNSGSKKGKSNFFKCILCTLGAFNLSENCVSLKNKIIEKIESANVDIEKSVSSSALTPPCVTKEDLIDTDIEFVVQKSEDIREKIVIVDDLKNPVEFRNSSNILKEIKKVSDLKIELAYPLAKGGIAIHTESRKSRDSLLESLSSNSFGGGTLSTLSKSKNTQVFIKNVDTKVGIGEIRNKLNAQGLDFVKCDRIINSFTQRPTKTIKVVIDSEVESKFLGIKIKVEGVVCLIEKKQPNPVVRCYACQQFGHIAKNCKAVPKCVVCAGSHKSNYSCSNPIRCGNCDGNHLSSYNRCPVFIERHESLTKQHPKHQHIEEPAQCSN